MTRASSSSMAGSGTVPASATRRSTSRPTIVASRLTSGVTARATSPTWFTTMEQHGDDVAELIRQLGLDRPVLVGQSMGGQVIISAAARHPRPGWCHSQSRLPRPTSPGGT